MKQLVRQTEARMTTIAEVCQKHEIMIVSGIIVDGHNMDFVAAVAKSTTNIEVSQYLISVFLSYVDNDLAKDHKPKRMTAALVACMSVEIEVQPADSGGGGGIGAID